MKSVSVIRNVVRTAATTLLCLGFAAASFAAKNPLNQPNGLAVDGQGNLYVANTGANSILVFNSKYKLSETISNVQHPTGVAIDPQGNAWVANWEPNGGFFSEYVGGKLNPYSVVTEGVDEPLAIAVDGLGNVWVQNSQSYIDIYTQPAIYSGSTYPTLQQTFNIEGPLYGIAVQENSVAIGGLGLGVVFGPALSTIMSGSFNSTYVDADDTGYAVAGDGHGNFYLANIDNAVAVAAPGARPVEFLSLTFTPAGIAVDPVNERLYVSNFSGNLIQVYSTTTAKLIETIQ